MKVVEDYEICFESPLNLKVGDEVQLFKEDVPLKWKGWNLCKDKTGNQGWISETYILRIDTDTARIIKNYTAREINASKDEEVEVLYTDCGWAWCKKTDGVEGWLPSEVLIES